MGNLIEHRFCAQAPIQLAFPNRDRGKPLGFTPPTPPDIRVRIRRFGRLCGLGGCERSSTVGMSRARVPPDAFGISTRRTG